MENIGIVHELCAVMASLTGQPESQYRELITFVPDRPGHDWRYAMDIHKASNELGWSPQIRFEDGLRDTIAWYEDNTAWWEAVLSKKYLAFYDSWYGGRPVQADPQPVTASHEPARALG